MRMFGIILLVVTSTLLGQGQSTVTKTEDLKGLAGCWEQRDDAKKLLISEQWMAPAGTSILGMGRTVRDGKTTDWEYMRIEQRSDGIFFVAKPRGNDEETAFRLIGSPTDQFVFENKEHDFPQRVVYKFSRTRLTGRIEGMNNGKFVGIDFPMERVNCG